MSTTRSGATFSPFVMLPIENPTFNLAESIEDALEQMNYEDDASLISPPPDPDATLFWKSDTPALLHRGPFLLSAASNLNTKHSGQNARVHGKRAKKQAAKAKAEGLGHHPPRPRIIKTHVINSAAIETKLEAQSLPRDSSGYIARGKRLGEGIYFKSLEILLSEGYKLIEWDGVAGRPLTCSEGRVFAVLVGQPQKSEYAESCKLAYEAIMQEGRSAQFSDKEIHHCRGDFPAVNVGVTMGFGATYPTNLSSAAHSDMIQRLLKNPDIIRMANFADGAFNLWAPKLHQHFRNHLDPLFKDLTYLQQIFSKSIFPSAAFNFGGNVFTKAHRDCMNSAIGWCAIHALGSYNPKHSGHLVLPDLKLVIEFPPGALIFIPSATLTHANLPVAEGESRVSFTQYCGGGLLRYVANGYRMETQLRKENFEEYMRMCDLKRTRWMEDIRLYSFLRDFDFPFDDQALAEL
ncbi:hypothetical protein C0992_013012 [Termitomyces sp. T32_za158]|nr:hypothetical protein C0992_013012 [Termitomyces sp. T32_za158]